MSKPFVYSNGTYHTGKTAMLYSGKASMCSAGCYFGRQQKETRNSSGLIVVQSGFQRSHILAEKLCILREVLSAADQGDVTKTLRESALILIQGVFGSIGMFEGNEKDVKDYLERQKSSYGGNAFSKSDRDRDSNIDKVKMTLGIITGCKF